MNEVPTSTLDLFETSDPQQRYEQYSELREIGPVVRLEGQDVYAVTRYEEVKQALSDHDSLISGEGVGFNPDLNQLMRGTTLASDPPEHELPRSVVATGLQPRAIRNRRDEVVEKARELVAAVLERGEVEGVVDIAQAMPLAVIPDFLELPERNRENLFSWAKGGTDLTGPVSDRTPGNLE